MPKNTPYIGMGKTELEELLKRSKIVPSFAGTNYVKMHKSIVSELQEQKDRNAKAAQRNLHIVINSGGSDCPRLHPDLQSIIDDIVSEASKDSNYHEYGVNLDDIRELAIANISIDGQHEQRAAKIVLQDGDSFSRKLPNIRFHLRGVISLIAEWLLIGDICDTEATVLLVMLLISIGRLYKLSLVNLDLIHAIILRELYQAPKFHGAVDDTSLVDTILRKHQDDVPGLNAKMVNDAISELLNWNCIDIQNGKIFLIETLIIK